MCASCTALNAKRAGVVSSDAVYRQTFYKERLWRERSAYLGIKAAAALVVSDVHPTDEGAPDWHWHMDGDMRRAALERVVSAVVDEAV